jgi:hypothetical protein
MMWASPTRHPGFARMMVAKRPRHGFAMINNQYLYGISARL